MAWWHDHAAHPGNGGIWHETDRLAGGMEAIYSGIPRIGPAGFAPERDPAGSFRSARQRIGDRSSRPRSELIMRFTDNVE